MKIRNYIIVLLLLFCNLTYATDYYVNAVSGSNTTGNGSSGTPWKTITYALSQISGTGHTIHVAPGTYNTALGEIFPIVIKNGVSLSNADTASAIINADGTGRVFNCIGITDLTTVLEGLTITGGSLTETYTQGGGIFISAGSALTIKRNKIINNSVGTWGSGGAIYITNSSPRILNNTITGNAADAWGNGDAIAIATGSAPEIKGNIITGSSSLDSYGIIYINSSANSPRIINNVIAHNGGPAIACPAGVPTILNNTISDNTGNGIYLPGGKPDSVINNIITGNAGYGIYENGTQCDPGKVSFNLFSGNASGLYFDEGATAFFTVSTLNSGVAECKNNIDGDPMFINSLINDYHENKYSPVIDMGDPAFPYSNEPVPNGSRINIGAYGNTSEAAITAIPPVLPADLYVNGTTGNNTSGDGTTGNPWKTITYALTQITGTGHIIHVAAGTYDSALGELLPIKMKNGVSLSGADPATTIIKAAGTGRVFYCVGVTDPATFLEGFTITGGSLSDTWSEGAGIYISAGTVMTVRNNIIKGNSLGTYGYGNGIFITGSSPHITGNTISDNSTNYWGGGNGIAIYNSSPLIEKNILINNKNTASNGCIYIYGSSGSARIIGNIIAKNSDDGIYCGAGTPTIINNTISNNTGDGISINSVSPDSIFNNILSFNTGYGISESGSTSDPVKAWYNLFYANEGGLYSDEASISYFTANSLNNSVTECKNNIEGDPLFVLPGSNDYHILPGSPAINAGDPNSPPDPNGSRADIGAYYCIQPPPAPVANNASFTGQTDFNASWNSAVSANGYFLDVATNSAFTSYVAGYENRDVSNVLSYSVIGLTGNTTYYYRLRAYNIDGTGISSNTITVLTLTDPPAVPVAPVSSPATGITQTEFTANWSSVSNATSYRIDVAPDNLFNNIIGSYNNVMILNALNCKITGLSANTQYYYRIRACNSGGTSPSSLTISLTTLPDRPPAPLSIAAGEITQTSFKAAWNSASTSTGYFLDVSVTNDFTTFISGFNNKDVGNVTAFTVTGLNPFTDYYYRVRAYNGTGTGDNSNTITVRTLQISPPVAPVATAATNITQTGFTANWEISATATGYYLDVATDIGFTTYVNGYQLKNVGNVISSDVSGLTVNTIYYFRVSGINAGGTGAVSNSVMVTTLLNPPPAPDPPQANAASGVTNTGFTANWGSSAGATGYKLDVSTDQQFNSFLAGYNSKDVSVVQSLDLTNLTPNTFYYYRVVAYNSGGNSSYSATITVKTLPDPPSPPAALAATVVQQTSFTARWNSSATATGYRLDISTDNTFATFLTGYNDKDAGNVTSLSVTGLSLNTVYYYRVRAYNSGGTSDNSNTITVTTLLNPPSAPPAPVALSASGLIQTGFTARWESQSSATGYRIDVSTSSSFYSYLSGYYNLDAGNATTIQITGLSAKTSYYYRVRAYNSAGTSGNSNTMAVTTLPNAPAAPTGLTGTSCSGQVTLTWTASTAADFQRYRIYGGTSVNPSAKIDSTEYGVISANSKTISGLVNGQTYYFRITTVISPGVASSYSTTFSIKVKKGVVPVIKSKWNDILICYNIGDSISSFQWYKGTTAIAGATKQYYITNKQPGSYNVVATGKDGCINPSNIINIAAGKSLTIYPNPAKKSFTLNLNSEALGKTIATLYNSSGRKVAEYQLQKSDSELIFDFPASSLLDGIYTLEILVNDEELSFSRVIIIN